MSDDILIRAATLDDLAVLLRFEQGVVGAERPHAQNLKDDPITYYDLPALIESDQVALLVAQSTLAIVGCGYVRIEPSKPQFISKQHGYLGFMYVEPAWRGRHVNKRILDGLLEWAEPRGVATFVLDVYVGNESAIKAYEKAGFKSNMLEMVMTR